MKGPNINSRACFCTHTPKGYWEPFSIQLHGQSFKVSKNGYMGWVEFCR